MKLIAYIGIQLNIVNKVGRILFADDNAFAAPALVFFMDISVSL